MGDGLDDQVAASRNWSQPRWWVIAAIASLAGISALAAGARIYRVRAAVASVERFGGFVAASTHNVHPLRRLFGRKHLGIADGPSVVDLRNTGISDTELRVLIADLRQFERVFAIKLQDAKISDEGLGMLTEFTELRALDLSNVSVTDAGLEQLQQLPELRRLNLDGTQITGAGLIHLVRLGRLEQLSLDGTEVDDDGIQPLARLATLRDLSLSNTDVTEAGVSSITTALPALDVTDD